MKKITTLTVLLLVTVFLSGCFALTEPEASSGDVVAPTLAPAEPQEDAPSEAPPVSEMEADEAADDALDAYPAGEEPQQEAAPESSEPYPAEESMSEPQQVEPPDAYPADAAYPAEEAAPGDEPIADPAAEVSADLPLYEIDPAQSEARFTIKEVLRGEPTTVVGVSRNLGGQIAFDINNPATAQVGTILINARDFATDNEFRNNAIANEILLTNEYEFVTFEPTAISGLPQTAEIGQTYAIQISGILGITDATREVTFDAQVTPLSENELAGLAAVEILYADYGLTIPFARSVESVEDNVLLELDFVATRS